MFPFKELIEITAKGFASILIPLIVAFVTFRISMKQITNTGVTQFRQQWINTLRDTLSEFISKAEFIVISDDEEKCDDAYHDMVFAQYKVELLLNSNENDHNELLRILEVIRNLVFEEPIDEIHFDENIDWLLSQSKTVLKREWNVVKSGK